MGEGEWARRARPGPQTHPEQGDPAPSGSMGNSPNTRKISDLDRKSTEEGIGSPPAPGAVKRYNKPILIDGATIICYKL